MKRNSNIDRPMHKGNQRGFTLIELLIVVAIILVIAAFALPSMMNAIRASRETSATQSLRAIATANTNYKQTFPVVGYSAQLKDLGGDPVACASGAVSATAACDLSDNNLALSGTKAEYTFTYTVPAPGTYLVVATPSNGLLSGRREFCIDQTNVVHATPAGTIGAITDDASCNGQPSL